MTHQDPAPLTYAKVLAIKPGFQVNNPPGLREVRTSTLAEGRILQYGGTARFTASLPRATTITSTTAFRKLEYDVVNDADITELNLTSVHLHEAQHQWTEEVTISQQHPRLTWIAGLFLFDELDHQPTVITLAGARLNSHLTPTVEADNKAVFGQATIDLTSRVSTTAGLRYSREDKLIDNAGGSPHSTSRRRWCLARRTHTRMPSPTLPGRRSSAWRFARGKTCSPMSRRRAASRAAGSTSRRQKPAAATPPSGPGAMRAG